MKAPGFMHGVGLALAISVAGSALFALFTQVTGVESALQLIIALAAAAYLLFLLRGRSARVGRVTTVLAWTAVSAVSWILNPGLLVYLLVQMALLWLVRCVYFYNSLLAALLDFGLQVLSLGAALWALEQTGSLLLSLWSFFLVQALFVAIPPAGLRPAQSTLDCAEEDAGFTRAHRSAEAALRRLL